MPWGKLSWLTQLKDKLPKHNSMIFVLPEKRRACCAFFIIQNFVQDVSTDNDLKR